MSVRRIWRCFLKLLEICNYAGWLHVDVVMGVVVSKGYDGGFGIYPIQVGDHGGSPKAQPYTDPFKECMGSLGYSS